MVELIDYVTSSLEDNRAGVIYSSIDFSKAFNRLDHTKCLSTFSHRGLSNELLGLLGAFLTGRSMTVKVGQKKSIRKPVPAGAPQGSVLGCYLFNVAVDELELGHSCEETANEPPETASHDQDFPAASTPVRVGRADRPPDVSPFIARTQPNFEFLPKAKNVPPWLRKSKEPHWVPRPILSIKFVDDGANAEKINLKMERTVTLSGHDTKIVTPNGTQSLLRHISERAGEQGMTINESKTSLMCFTAATSFKVEARVKIKEAEVRSAKEIKILGVTLDNKCSFRKHAVKVANKIRARTWALPKLKRAGLDTNGLVRFYKNMIRPAAEYAAPAWHSMLTASQSALIERQQSLALRNIYGTGQSAAKMRALADLPLLAKRREEATLKFAKKCLTNKRSENWFESRPQPRFARRLSLQYDKFREATARTDRHRNSPKLFMTRLLNQNQ